jgi:hypothetical protein
MEFRQMIAALIKRIYKNNYIMKHLFYFFLAGVLVLVTMQSCSPTITPLAPTTLAQTKTYSPIVRSNSIMGIAPDTNVYAYDLTCGCSFLLGIDGADTSSITYNTKDFKDTIIVHNIMAGARAGLAKGQHTGWLAITTIQPVTTELLKDTLRDTVIVP